MQNHCPTHRVFGALAILFFLGACAEAPTNVEVPDAVFAKKDCSPGSTHPGCKNGGGGDDGDASGGVTYHFPDESGNALRILEADGADLWNDGGRWLDVGFVGEDGLPGFTLAYDATEAGLASCEARNLTESYTAEVLGGFLTSEVPQNAMYSGRLTVDKKNTQSTEHLAAIQFVDGGVTIRVALVGVLGAPITVTGDPSANPADVTLTGGTVRVRAKLGGSASTDPVLDCAHLDQVQAIVAR